MSDTHFAILRVERVKSKNDLAGADRHGRREDTGTHFDPERTPFNWHWSACRVVGPVDLIDGVDRAAKRLGAVTRKGATVAAEFFVSASPEYFDPVEGEDSYFNMRRVIDWAEATMAAFYKRYGRAVIAARLDLDEGGPHIALWMLPTYTKITKHSEKAVVSYRKVFGGDIVEAGKKMIDLQDWYAGEMAPLGLTRGVPKTVTHRGHLTHQQYARKRDKEDKERLAALARAEQQAAELQRRNEELEKRLELVKAHQRLTRGKHESAAKLLIETENALTWLTNIKAQLAAYDPHGPIIEALEGAAPAFDKIESHVQELAELAEQFEFAEDEPSPAGP